MSQRVRLRVVIPPHHRVAFSNHYLLWIETALWLFLAPRSPSTFSDYNSVRFGSFGFTKIRDLIVPNIITNVAVITNLGVFLQITFQLVVQKLWFRTQKLLGEVWLGFQKRIEQWIGSHTSC